MKKILCAVLFIFLIACETEHKQASALINFIPKTAGAIIKLPKYDAFEEKLKSNDFVSKNSEFPLFTQASKALSFTRFLNLKNPSLITFSNEGKGETVFSLITRESNDLISPEGKKKITDSLEYDSYYIKRLEFDGKTNFFTNVDSVFVLSDSRLIVENVIRQKDYPVSEELMKAYNTSSGKNAAILVNHDQIDDVIKNLLPFRTFLDLKNFAEWTALDIEVDETSLKLNGIATTAPASPQILDIFQNLSPQENEIAKVTPLNAEGIYSFTYNDFSKLKNNIDAYHVNRETKQIRREQLFNLTKEIGVLSFKTGKALVLNTTGIIEAQEQLTDQNQVAKNFRERDIFQFNEGNIFRETLSPLIFLQNQDFYTIIEHFIVFSAEIETLEHIIANYQNETTLVKQEFYQNASSNLSSESSILLIAINKNIQEKVAAMADNSFRPEIKEIDFKQYPITALQFIADNNFTHVHGVLRKAEASASSGGTITQVASATLESNLVTKPVLFTNHYNKQKEVIVQDDQNQLYLISSSGNILWNKQLEGPILGEIKQVDLFKNNKYQIAFATPNKLYVLDRNGDEVKPFPINLKNNVTQPLSVFDYDNNRNYRFVISQGESLTMYDGNGKIVSGFNFKRANGEIVQSPKHIRIGRKDYILIPDASGKLHIVDRQGNARVKVKEKINFSGNAWFLYKNHFASTNAEGDLVLIDEKGAVKTEELDLAGNHMVDATEKTLVSISENKLHIEEKEVELEYGVYTEPQIFYINDKLYIAITDLQAHKVFVYNSDGQLMPNFPVYGNSSIQLDNFDADKNLEFVVQGEENSILFYQIN